VSAAIGALVPEHALSRLLPRSPALAVPVAGVAGAVLPGCECASVPVADSLMRRGVAPAPRSCSCFPRPRSTRSSWSDLHPIPRAAADGGGPVRRLARYGGRDGLAVGTLRSPGVAAAAEGAYDRIRDLPAAVFAAGLQHDFRHAGGFLLLGSAAAATFDIAVPRTVLDVFTGSAWLSVPLLALLLFPPPALGSYSAAREDAQRAAQGVGTFPARPATRWT
jgi:uncharacterized protein